MLNGMGGFVLFGVTGRGQINGQAITENTLNDIANELARLEPPAFPDIETVVTGEDRAVVVRFPPPAPSIEVEKRTPFMKDQVKTYSPRAPEPFRSR